MTTNPLADLDEAIAMIRRTPPSSSSVTIVPTLFAPPPRPPTPGEQGVRLVRQGMAEILEWLGEKVGPEVDALVHTAYMTDGMVFVHPYSVGQITGAPATEHADAAGT